MRAVRATFQKFNCLFSNIYYRTFYKKDIIVKHPFGLQNIELTNKCPMKCCMCVRTYNMTRPHGFMDYDVFIKIINETIAVNPNFIKKETFWLHHFGESLLHPDFDKFISYCSSRGVKVGLSINPIMLTEDVSTRLIRSKPHLLYLALDGHDDDSFFRIRGIPNAFTKSKENTLSFLKLIDRYKSIIKIYVCMIDFEQNAGSIKEMVDYWRKQKGISDVFIKPFTEWNGDVKQISILNSDHNVSAKKTSVINRDKTINTKCLFPWQTFSITWDGNVVPCCNDYDNKYVLGNVKDNTLMEIWNGENMKKLRMEFLGNDISNKLCINCEYAK